MLKNMGCKSNQLEGNLIEENLVQNGYNKCNNLQECDFFILNSCTVTHKSDNEAFQILNKIKKTNPTIKTVLTGCIAQIEKEKLLQNPNVDFVIGNNEKLEISKYIQDNSACEVKDIMELETFSEKLVQNSGKTRASLKIQDGCNHRCTYCIIPFARGKNRSADVNFITNQIKIYEDMGFKEIVLTGIHIGQWGLDFADKKNIFNLLQEIEEKTNIQRYRLGSLNPLEISDEMLDFLKNSEKFCPHFHLSLQSMCDKTLKSMNRHYSSAQALELIDKIASHFSLPFIGSDIIAGFAGEREKDFEKTLNNLKNSKLTQIHTFPYSIRQGTKAASYDDQLDSKTKEHRAKLIKEISEQKHKEFLNKNIGTIQEIIVEKNIDKKTGFIKGVTKNYITVLAQSEENFEEIKNTIRKIKIESISPIIKGSLIN